MTIDGAIEFDALIDARGQAAAPVSALPFPSLVGAMVDPDQEVQEPFELALPSKVQGAVYCLAMPQILKRHPFSQGLANCDALGRSVAKHILGDR